MGGTKGIVGALATHRKSADSVQLAQGMHPLAPSGQDFVRIGLMAHIPHDAVVRRVEHIVQRHGEFNRTEVGAEVPTGLGNAVQQIRAQFIGQRLQLLTRQAAQISR
mgnify:CR=1 FL=1